MPTRTVLVDAYNWSTPSDVLPNRFDRHTAYKGDTIDVSDAEAARGDGLGALGSPDDLVARQAAPADASGFTASDEELAAMTVEELSAYVTQHPDEVDRVVTLEEARDRPRKGVLELRDGAPPVEQ